MNLSHKIQFYPTKTQAIQLKKACGTARYTYNWALARSKDEYAKGNKQLSLLDLKKIWNKEKPEWVYESPKDANQQPFINLNNAYKRFFKRLSKFPKFKKKGNNDSFYVSNDQFKLQDNKIKLPKIGWIKLAEQLRFEGKINNAVVSRKAGKWFVAISVQTDVERERISDNKIGIDLGLNTAVVTSDEEMFSNPKPFKQQKDKIAKLQRQLSRKKLGSNNRKKHIVKLQKAYLRLSDIRKDFWHKVTSKLCNENQVMCIEDLNVKGMIKNRKLSFSLSDSSLGMFRPLLEYKKEIWNNEVVLIDRWYPSSQLCNICGNRKKMSLSQRTYNCDNCGLVEDRDVNAAKNILTAGLVEINVCGQETSGYELCGS